ncbi:MAG TPA: hypothetical protein VJ970_05225, partial [Flavobacteriaceae bacterium]|nr:hypothetical protein [Flavobacteriaceae bacterium]
NNQGEGKAFIKYDFGLQKNNVVLTNGHWHCNGASPNLFTKGMETDMGYGTAFHNTWVDIKNL